MSKLVPPHGGKLLPRLLQGDELKAEMEKAREAYQKAVELKPDYQQAWENLGLAHYFECIIDSAIVGVEKPDPAIFEIALGEMQVAASHCLHIGDNYDRDVIGARNARLTPVLIDPYGVVAENDVTKIKVLADLLALLPQERR